MPILFFYIKKVFLFTFSHTCGQDTATPSPQLMSVGWHGGCSGGRISRKYDGINHIEHLQFECAQHACVGSILKSI